MCTERYWLSQHQIKPERNWEWGEEEMMQVEIMLKIWEGESERALTLFLLRRCRPLHICRERRRMVTSVWKHLTVNWSISHLDSLVGGVVVADHLRQDPLLVSVHRLHPRCHFVALFGHVVAAGRSRPAQRRRADGRQSTEWHTQNKHLTFISDFSWCVRDRSFCRKWLKCLPPYVNIQIYDEHSRRCSTGLFVNYDGSVFTCVLISCLCFRHLDSAAGFVFRKELKLDV